MGRQTKTQKHEQARELVERLFPELSGKTWKIKATTLYRLLMDKNYYWSVGRSAWMYQPPLPGFEV